MSDTSTRRVKGIWAVKRISTAVEGEKPQSEEFRGAVRVARYKLVNTTPEQDIKWTQIATEVQRLYNRTWREFRQYHEDKGHDKLVAEWMVQIEKYEKDSTEAFRAEYAKRNIARLSDLPSDQREETKKKAKEAVRKLLGDPPKCPVNPMPKDLRSHIGKLVTQHFQMNSRVGTVGLNTLVKDITKHRAAKGRLKRWQRVLVDLEGQCFNKPQPIPFDTQNAAIIPPEDPTDDKAEWMMKLRLDRGHAPKTQCIPDIVSLKTEGKKLHNLRRVLRDCVLGTLKFCGSNLIRDESGCWYIHLCYQERKLEPIPTDPNKTATLRPMVTHPLGLFIGDERERWIGGRGRVVIYMRKRFNAKRGSMRELYKSGGKRGHGRSRTKKYYLALNCLARGKKTLNQQWARDAFRYIQEKGVGKLVFCRPTEQSAKRTFLFTAGSHDERPDTWPWHILETCLSNICSRLGVEFSVQPMGVDAMDEQKADE